MWFTAFLGIGITSCAFTLPHFIIPGREPPKSLWGISIGTGILLPAGIIFYPVQNYEHFGRAIVACFSIGMIAAIATATACSATLRRGLIVAPWRTGAMCGLLSGMTGFLVLFLFCPHQDAGHYWLGHATVIAFSVLACAALFAAPDRFSDLLVMLRRLVNGRQ
jgi:hypothetical protein